MRGSKPLAAAIAAATLMTPTMGLIAQSAAAATTDATQTQVDQSDLEALNKLEARVDGKSLTFTKDNTSSRNGWSYDYDKKFPAGAIVTVSNTKNGMVTSLGGLTEISAIKNGTTVSVYLEAVRTAANQRFSSGWKGEPLTVDGKAVATAEQAGYGGVHVVYGALASSGSPSIHGPEGTNMRHTDDERVYAVTVPDRSNGAETLFILTAAPKGGLTSAEREFAEGEIRSHNINFNTEFTLDTLPGVETRPDYGATKKGDANGDGVFDAKDLDSVKATSGGKAVAGFDGTNPSREYLVPADTVEFSGLPEGWTMSGPTTDGHDIEYTASDPDDSPCVAFRFHRKASLSDRDRNLIKAMGLTVNGRSFDPTDGLYVTGVSKNGTSYGYAGNGVPAGAAIGHSDKAGSTYTGKGWMSVQMSDDDGYRVSIDFEVKDITKDDTGRTDKPSTGKDDTGKDDTSSTDKPSGGKTDTDPSEGLTDDERTALSKLDYRDAGEDPAAAPNIIKSGQTVYTGLKGGKGTVVSDKTSDPFVNRLLSNHIRWYKGATQVKAGEPFDTEIVEYTGRTSGRKVTFVFTTLDHNPLAATSDTGKTDTPSTDKPSDDTDKPDTSATPDASKTSNGTAETDNTAATGSGLASTGVSAEGLMAVTAAVALAAGVMGLGAMERRRD